VSFVIPENLFSEDDYAAAVALQEAETGNDSDDEHDYARTLAGTPPFPPSPALSLPLPPFIDLNARVFHCSLDMPPRRIFLNQKTLLTTACRSVLAAAMGRQR
jgi:hypothetical protein